MEKKEKRARVENFQFINPEGKQKGGFVLVQSGEVKAGEDGKVEAVYLGEPDEKGGVKKLEAILMKVALEKLFSVSRNDLDSITGLIGRKLENSAIVFPGFIGALLGVGNVHVVDVAPNEEGKMQALYQEISLTAGVSSLLQSTAIGNIRVLNLDTRTQLTDMFGPALKKVVDEFKAKYGYYPKDGLDLFPGFIGTSGEHGDLILVSAYSERGKKVASVFILDGKGGVSRKVIGQHEIRRISDPAKFRGYQQVYKETVDRIQAIQPRDTRRK